MSKAKARTMDTRVQGAARSILVMGRLLAAVILAGGCAVPQPVEPDRDTCREFSRLKESALRSLLGDSREDQDTWRIYLEDMSEMAGVSANDELVDAVKELSRAGDAIMSSGEPAATELDAPRLFDALIGLERVCADLD